MKKILIVLSVFLLALLAVSAVSANENITDSDILTDDADEILCENEGDVISQDAGDAVSTGEKSPTKISSSNVVGYTSFSTQIQAKLTSNGKALSSKTVNITVAGSTYTKTTGSDGKVSLKLNLKKGTYDAVFSYGGDNATDSSTKTIKLTIKNPTKTKLKVGDKDINYRQGSKCLFYVKLTTDKGKAIKNQMVTIKVAGKTYTVKTNKNGNAKIYLNLKKGTHKIKYSFKKNAPYLASKGSIKIKAKPKMAKGDGYWLWPAHMKTINLKSLASKGTKHIFLNSYALSVHGKSSVESFIRNAHRYGIKVHLWMQVAYEGKWVSLVDDNGKIKYSFLNKKIRQAKSLAKIKGVDGIHFDYMRYGGTAHKHPNAKESINWFVKKASKSIRSVKPNCIISIAIMPEPKMMLYYYGQDVPTLSKYVDALLPMAYKGNYHQKTSWIGKVTKKFVSQSNGAQIWTGLQSYHSDNNAQRLTQKALLKDAKSAMKGGAKGVILFRIGISCNFNFKKV